MKIPFSRNNRGVSLVEVLVGVAVLSTVVGVTSRFYGTSYKAKSKIRIRAVMEMIAKDAENKLRSPSSIYLSLMHAGNSEMLGCFLGAGDGCRTELTRHNEAKPNKFVLAYSVSAEKLSGMSSSPQEPMYYNTHGKKCKLKEKSCVFTLDTFYYARCPTPDPCPQGPCKCGADQISVGFKLTQLDNTLKELGSPLPALPARIKFHTMSAEEILGPYLNSSCNSGAVIQGYDEKGRGKCVCTQPYIERKTPPTSNRRGPLCQLTREQDFACPTGQLFRGLKADGTADCYPVSSAFDCISKTGEEAHVIGGCGPDYFVRDDVMAQCKFYCKVGEGGGICFSEELVRGNSNGPGITFKYPTTPQTLRGDRVRGPDQRKIYRYWVETHRPKGSSRNPWDYATTLAVESAFDAFGFPIPPPETTTTRELVVEGLVCDVRRITCCKPSHKSLGN